MKVHQLARTPDDLLAVFQRISHSVEAYNAVVTVITEWMTTSSQAQPIRTERIQSDSYGHGGWGAGAGDVERYVYRCPCGDGTIVEEHENVPGFRDHDVSLNCDRCRAEWSFAAEGAAADALALLRGATGQLSSFEVMESPRVWRKCDTTR